MTCKILMLKNSFIEEAPFYKRSTVLRLFGRRWTSFKKICSDHSKFWIIEYLDYQKTINKRKSCLTFISSNIIFISSLFLNWLWVFQNIEDYISWSWMIFFVLQIIWCIISENFFCILLFQLFVTTLTPPRTITTKMRILI